MLSKMAGSVCPDAQSNALVRASLKAPLKSPPDVSVGLKDLTLTTLRPPLEKKAILDRASL